MCRSYGRRLKAGLLIYLALLLLWPCSCWGDVVLTDQEATALKASLRKADEQLQKAQSELETSNAKLQTAEQRLERAEKESAELQKELQEQEKRYETLSTSWKKQRSEARWGKVKSLLIGLGIGIAGGIAGGFYLANR